MSSKLWYLTFLLTILQAKGPSAANKTDQQESPSGGTLVLAGKFKEAADKFSLSFKSNQKKFYNDLSEAMVVASTGMVYFSDGKFAEAASLFQEALTASNAVAQETMMATAATTSSVLSSCTEASLLAVRAHILLKQGNFHEAIDMLRAASSKVGDITDMTLVFDNCINAITIAVVGKTLLTAGNFKESTDIFQRAYEKSDVDAVSMTLLNLKTQSGYAWEGLSSIIQLKCFDNASKSFQNAYEKSTIRSFYYTFAFYRDASNIAKQGSDFLKLGKFTDPLEHFQKAINIFHVGTFSSYINATKSAEEGLLLLTEGKAIDALEHFQNALLMRHNIFPEDVHVLVNCRETVAIAAEGQLLMTQRKFHEALVKFHEAYSKSTVREVKYMLSRLKKLPYEGGNYCSHDDFAAVEHA